MESPSSFNTANNRSRSSSEAEADAIHVAQYETYDRYMSDEVPTTAPVSGPTPGMSRQTPSHSHYDSATATPTINYHDVASPTSPSSMYSDYGRMTPAAESYHDSDVGDTGRVTGDTGSVSSGVGLGFAGIPRSGLPFNYESEVRSYGGDESDHENGADDTSNVTHDTSGVSHDISHVTHDTRNVTHDTHDTHDTGAASASPVPGAFPDIDSEEYTVGANAHKAKETGDMHRVTRDTGNVSRDTGNVSRDMGSVSRDIERVTHNTTGVTHDSEPATHTYNTTSPIAESQSFGHYSPATHDSDVDHLEPPSPAAVPPVGDRDGASYGDDSASYGDGSGSGAGASYGASYGTLADAPAPASALADARAPARVSRFSFSDRSPSKPDVSGHYRSHSQTGTSPNKSATRKLHKSKVSQTSIESFSLPKGDESREITPDMDKKLGEYNGRTGSVAFGANEGRVQQRQYKVLFFFFFSFSFSVHQL